MEVQPLVSNFMANVYKKWQYSDDFGLRSPIIQKTKPENVLPLPRPYRSPTAARIIQVSGVFPPPEGGMKQIWVGIKGILGEQAGEAVAGIATAVP